MSQIFLKQLIGLLFIVFVCKASLVSGELAQDDLTAGLDLDQNRQGQFLAETGQDVQASDLDEQLFKGGLFQRFYGHRNRRWSRRYPPLYGGFALTRYLTTSLKQSPIYFDIDDDYLYFNKIGDRRSGYSYNYDDYDFSVDGSWGDLTSYGSHYGTIGRLFQQTTRIVYQNNFYRCYNPRNQVVIVFQRINNHYREGSPIWSAPVYPRSYRMFPRLSVFGSGHGY